ncbi:MAG: 3'-5' exonuclease [Candidatus Diapherotrites archaeon]
MDLKEPVLGNLDSSDGSITPKGSKVLIKDFDCEKAELKWFVEYIKKLKKEKIIQNYSDIGVLFKSIKHQAKTHIKSLEEENIPVEVLGYSDLSNLNYIKEILCVFKEFNNNSRISNKFLELEVSKGFNSKRPLDLLYEILSNSNWFKNKIKNNDDNVLFNIASLSKILEIYQSTFNTNLDEFYKYFKNEFIDYFDTERPKNTNSVKVLTFHKSKGLEFPIVIIPRVDKNFFAKKEKDFLHSLFPDYDSTADFKRAKYVAITRARDLLVFSSVRGPPIELIKNRTLVYVSSNIANNILMQTEEIPKVRSVKEKEEIITLNHYKLEEFLKCPFSYKLRFYNKFSVLSNYALIYGAKLHGAVYRLNLLINKENINKDLEDLIKQSKYESQLKEKLERYLIDFNEETKDALLFPEKTFYSIVDGVIIKGKIDLLIQKSDDVKIICEFKSGSYNKIFEEKAKRQLELYFLALNDSKIKKGIIYFFGNPSKKIVFDFSPQTNLKLMEILNKIKLKNFEPDTKNCNLLNKCVFAKICPHYNKDAINGINEYYEDDNTDLELDDY